MDKIRIVLLAFLAIIIFSGCSTLGDNFFIINYEDQPVNIKYMYYTSDNITNSTDFEYEPKSFVLFADTILPKKVFKQFPYKSNLYFDSLDINMIDSLNYEFDIPSKSTIRIAPIYYGDNIEYVILNHTDTIKFVTEYPKVENEELNSRKIIVYKPRIVGDTYYKLNIRLSEISEILEE